MDLSGSKIKQEVKNRYSPSQSNQTSNILLMSPTSSKKIQSQSLAPIKADIIPQQIFNFNQFHNPHESNHNYDFENLNDLNIPNTIRHAPIRTEKIQILESLPNQILSRQIINSNAMSMNQDHQLIEKQQGISFLKLKISDDEENCEKIQDVFYPQTYKQGHGFLSQLFNFDIIQYMWKVKSQIINEGLKLRIQHLPVLEEDEKIENLFKSASETYQNVFKSTGTFNKKDIIKLLLFGQLKSQFFLILFLNLIDSVGKNFVSILMGYLIKCILLKDLQGAYIYGVIVAIINMVTLIARNNAAYMAFQYQIKVRMILINLLYQNITQLNSFSIKQANLGKILNTISSDLNLLELNIPIVFQLIVLPISLAFGCGILYTRFNGPIGMVGVLFMIILYPLQYMYQQIALTYTIKLRQHGDLRLKLQNEMIQGIRMIKMYAWEQAFVEMIMVVRRKEFGCIYAIALLNAWDRSLNYIVHVWASFFFFVLIYFGGYANLTAANMIPTIYTMFSMRTTCIQFVSLILNAFINVRISFHRIAALFNLRNIEMLQPESKASTIQDDELHTLRTAIPILQFRNYSCYWTTCISKPAQPVLKNINLDIYPGELVAIVGQIGSGKSSLFSSIVMEVPSHQGRYYINGDQAINQLKQISIGHVEQDPFILPDSLKNNIIFGRPFDQYLYNLVIQVSCLYKDLRLMQNGDETQLSEKGFNLSKGQKARVSLARALYQMADVYLFDTILASVDAKVARSIFDNAIKDFIFKVQPKLSGVSNLPVVLIITHQIQFAVECDYMIAMEAGSIVARGKYEDIKGSLNMISKEFLNIESEKDSPNDYDDEINTLYNRHNKFFRSNLSSPISPIDKKQIQIYQNQDNSPLELSLKTYLRYFKRWTPQYRIIIVIIQCLGQEVIYNLYLRYVSLFDYKNEKQEKECYLSFQILGILLAIAYLNNLTKYLLNTTGVLATNRFLHLDMLKHLSLSPIEFFDTNTPGRILNRFATDLQLAVTQQNPLLLDVNELTSFFIVSLFVLVILQKWMGFVILFVIICNVALYKFSYQIIIQARECDLVQRGPLLDIFKQTLQGITQIKLYGQQSWFQQNYFDLTNKCIQSNLAYYYTMRSFGTNMDIVAWIASTSGIFIIISLNASDIPSFIQALLLLLTFNDNTDFWLKQVIQSFSIMNAFNRMFQIVDLKPEAPHQMKIDDELKDSWPSLGKIEFKNVFMRYRKDTDMVLNNMNFIINAGDKVGCVGRTGTGKSSILQALFRLVEIDQASGSVILIDNQDISKLGLNFLRSSIGVIPQIPYVFSGTIRRNLDPFEKFTDDMLWNVLDETNLSPIVKNLTLQLDTDMTEINSIFSMGEHQLICLARIILNPKKIIILDEATADVDMKTDQFIQLKIREKFQGCTILTIAHRINTIANCDKVMVIDQGKVVEFGTPLELLSTDLLTPTIDRGTLFATLTKNNGSNYAASTLQIARAHYNEALHSK